MGPLPKLLFGSCVMSFDPGIKVNYIPTKYILAGNRPRFPHCKVDCCQRIGWLLKRSIQASKLNHLLKWLKTCEFFWNPVFLPPRKFLPQWACIKSWGLYLWTVLWIKRSCLGSRLPSSMLEWIFWRLIWCVHMVLPWRLPWDTPSLLKITKLVDLTAIWHAKGMVLASNCRPLGGD